MWISRTFLWSWVRTRVITQSPPSGSHYSRNRMKIKAVTKLTGNMRCTWIITSCWRISSIVISFVCDRCTRTSNGERERLRDSLPLKFKCFLIIDLHKCRPSSCLVAICSSLFRKISYRLESHLWHGCSTLAFKCRVAHSLCDTEQDVTSPK